VTVIAFTLAVLAVVAVVLRLTNHWPIYATDDNVRQFLYSTLDGLTAGAVYFLVASGFTLIFGLMRVVNMAHGALYLFAGYVGWSLWNLTGNWLVGMLVAAAAMAVVGVIVQQSLLRPLQNDVHSAPEALITVAIVMLVVYIGLVRYFSAGKLFASFAALVVGVLIVAFIAQQASFRVTQNRDLREALITIGLAIVAADLMLAHFGGLTYTITPPDQINGATNLARLTDTINHATAMHVFDLIYPTFRLFVLGLAVAVFILLWSMLNLTRLGMIVRAAIDDRAMVSALGINIQVVFALLFALGAALAGLAGGIEASLTSVTIGDDGTFLLWSLIVVIIGGMGSLGGAAIGAVLVGLLEQYGLAYSPTNAETIIFIVLVLVLAIRPQGLLGRPA
jgi:branched-chain amino acid transport system permease protein